MPVVEARQRAATSVPRRRRGTPAEMSEQTLWRMKPLLDQAPSNCHAQAFVALVRAEIIRLLPDNLRGFDINIRGHRDKAHPHHSLQVQYNPHSNDWNAIVNNLTQWLRQHTNNRKAQVRMDRIRVSRSNDRFWVQVSLPVEKTMAAAKRKTRSTRDLMKKVTGGKPDTRREIASSQAMPKLATVPGQALRQATQKVVQALKLEAAKPEEAGSTSLLVTLNIHNLGIGKRQLPELLRLANEEVKAQTGSIARCVLRESHTAGRDDITFIADISTGDHVMQDIDSDRFHPRPTKFR